LIGGWPHQIALPARFCENGGYEEIHAFCKELTLCARGHAVYDREWFQVYCFAKPDDDIQAALRRREVRSGATPQGKQLGPLEQTLKRAMADALPCK
jgi:hypothetical protein